VRRGGTLAVLLAGAGVGLVASGQPWWRASGDGAAVTFSGSGVTGGLCQTLAVVTLAGMLLVLVLRARGRRILAVALALAGLGMIATGVLQAAPDADTVRSRVRQVSLTDQFALSASAWPWAYAVAGLLVVVGAGLLWWGAPRWAGRVSRFEWTATPTGPASDLGADPAKVWRDLDAGLDPTADPDVRPGDGRVTMDPTNDHRQE
jgi:uncharacterized membrane protein (TIGR02234 family)